MSKPVAKTKRVAAKPKRASRKKTLKPYDAKPHIGRVEAFKNLTMQDIKDWRDDR